MTPDPILLVDDEEELRTFLKDTLIQDGYQVDDAPDARTALARMADKHYPVVLTDLNMPGGPTGFDLIAAVKARDPGTLCVVITGFASLETAVRAVKFGAYDFVQKPFKLAEIEAVLDRALSHATLVRQLRDYQKDLEARVLGRGREARELHEEMIALNALLVETQGRLEEAEAFGPFLAHLGRRYAPEAAVALLPAAGDTWTVAAAAGPGELGLEGLPRPSRLDGPSECPWAGGEGWLVPLRGDGGLLGAVRLGFGERSGFQPDAPEFDLWTRQLEAALLGLRRTRALVEAARAGRR